MIPISFLGRASDWIDGEVANGTHQMNEGRVASNLSEVPNFLTS